MGRLRSRLPEGITHGVVIWFLVGSLLGGVLFVNVYMPEMAFPRLPQTPALPTSSQAAYDAYLNGVDHGRDGDHHRSVEQYNRALEEDPQFSVAWAALSRAHSAMYFEGTDPTEQRLAMARESLDRAFQIDADLPEAHLALGYYYYRGPRDYERALEELAIAEPHFPEDADLLLTRALMYRSAGEWSAALFELGRAAEIAPGRVDVLLEQALTHLLRRDYVLCEGLLERALMLEPDNETARIYLAMLPLQRDGDTGALRAAAETALGSGRPWMAWLAAYSDHDLESARQALDESASDTLSWWGGYMPKALAYGLTHQGAGNGEMAQLHFETAREILEQDLETDPENADLLIALGEAHAHLGAHESAARLARRVMDVLEVSRDAFSGPRYRLAGARVLAAAGESAEAVRELEAYLSSPGEYSIGGILADPRFDTLRGDPGFQSLASRYR